MIHIAIAEDIPAERDQLVAALRQAEQQLNEEFQIQTFSDGSELLQKYPHPLDILLLDIQMAEISGMEAARQIRQFDDQVILIFVTSLAQYALDGYAVRAMDYLIKPVRPAALTQTLRLALSHLKKQGGRPLKVRTTEGLAVVDPTTLKYAEAVNHKVVLHCRQRQLAISDSLQNLEKQLAGERFFRIHSAFLVNLNQVSGVQGSDVIVSQDRLPLSKHRRKAFMEALAEAAGSWL
ncbi:LytR/AlgR family response regulator transcription factor [Holdemania massiliensis]|uniref:LytR/AlgR family response regulator transcription factor n=1 Tax=Holdemania massiliensis TaxID=1468449 RepID=UPI003522A9C5